MAKKYYHPMEHEGKFIREYKISPAKGLEFYCTMSIRGKKRVEELEEFKVALDEVARRVKEKNDRAVEWFSLKQVLKSVIGALPEGSELRQKYLNEVRVLV